MYKHYSQSEVYLWNAIISIFFCFVCKLNEICSKKTNQYHKADMVPFGSFDEQIVKKNVELSTSCPAYSNLNANIFDIFYQMYKQS